MTRIHKLGKYRDGYVVTEYCKVCSAEGIELQDDCPGNFPDPDKKVTVSDLERIEGELEDRCREG